MHLAGIFLCAGLLITAGYSLGFGPVCWVAQSEYFPTSIRGRCMALSVLVSNLGNLSDYSMFLHYAIDVNDNKCNLIVKDNSL